MPADYPAPYGQHGPAGYQRPDGFAGPGGPNGPNGPGGPGSPANAQGWNGDPGRGLPGWQSAGEPAQNGYPDYGYPAHDRYGQNVNGGEYAYVISDHGPRGARPAPPRGPQQPPAAEQQPFAGEPRRRTREERMQARPTGATRSITAGIPIAAPAASAPAPPNPPRNASPPAHANPPANANQSSAYGPDDPAYGPPEPGWSHQDRPLADVHPPEQSGRAESADAAERAGASAKAEPITAEPVTLESPHAQPPHEQSPHAQPLPAEQPAPEQSRPDRPRSEPAAPGQTEPEQPATPRPVSTDQPPVRGPFEPLVEHNRPTAAAASLSADDPATDPEGRPYEFPGLDDDEPAGSAAAALDRLKELHRTAAAVAPQSLDAHFDQLLERQRRLISEYISEAEAPPAATDDPGDDRLVGFGGDFLGSR
jgi:hypothetical protein